MIKTEFKKQNRKKEKEFRMGSKNKRMYNTVSERISRILQWWHTNRGQNWEHSEGRKRRRRETKNEREQHKQEQEGPEPAGLQTSSMSFRFAFRLFF